MPKTTMDGRCGILWKSARQAGSARVELAFKIDRTGQ
jgi:hypothetical protein